VGSPEGHFGGWRQDLLVDSIGCENIGEKEGWGGREQTGNLK
jgi:hypothetical protein